METFTSQKSNVSVPKSELHVESDFKDKRANSVGPTEAAHFEYSVFTQYIRHKVLVTKLEVYIDWNS